MNNKFTFFLGSKFQIRNVIADSCKNEKCLSVYDEFGVKHQMTKLRCNPDLSHYLPPTSWLILFVVTIQPMTPFMLFLVMLFQLSQEPAMSAKQVVKKATDNVRGESSQSEIIIRTVRPTWQREMTLKTWTQGDKYAMILVKSPVKDKGVAFLKRDKEVWNWVPVLERSIKMPPSMMTQSWMGTDFTNDDLVKESSLVEDYEHSFAGDTTIGNRDCYIIQMIPKPEAAIVWGKLIVCIDKKDFLELHTKFYDEEGELINIMNASEIKRMDGRLIPTYLEMIPTDKKNQKTVLIYSNISFNRPISASFFSLQQMKNLN